MKFFSYGNDGGSKSNVWGFWFIEFKGWFSIVLLCFEEGSREAYHTHAFNALTWFLSGNVDEHHLDGQVIKWTPSWKPKYTDRNCFHKVYSKKRTFALSIRGPWQTYWSEYLPKEEKFVILTNGRKIVDV